MKGNGAAWAGILALLLLLGGCAVGARGRVRQTAGQTSTDGQETTEIGTLVDLSLDRSLSEEWQLRFSNRSQRRAAVTQLAGGGGSSRSTTTSHQPSLDLVHTSRLWDVNFSVERRINDLSVTGPDNQVVRDNIFGRLSYHPSGLPTLTVQSEYATAVDDRMLDTTDLRTIFRVQHDLEDVTVFYEHAIETIEDLEFQERQDRTDDVLRLSGAWQDDGGVLAATFNLSHTQYSIQDRGAPLGIGTLPVSAGLFAEDDTPTLGSLATHPSLVDGDLGTGTGIQIGGVASGGGLNRNIGVDQGALPRPVDEVYLYVDALFTAQEAAQFNWAVYASSDNLTWTQVRAAAPFVFDAGRLRFVIQAGGVASRYVKVVNTAHAVAAAAVQVTEIRILGSQGALVSGTSERQERGDANVRLRPAEDLDFFVELGGGQTVRDDAGQRVKDESSYRYTVGSTWQPLEWLSGTVKTSRERFDDPLLITRDLQQHSGSVEVAPNERVTLEFSASRSREDRDDLPYIATDALFARSSVSLVHDMVFSLQASRSHQEEAQAGRRSDRDFLLASLYAPLRSNLEVRLDQQLDNLDVVETSGATTATENQMSGIEVIWRATPLLTLVADLEYWGRAVQQTGLTQRYRVDWLPFPEGQLLVQLDYRRESGGVILTPTESTFLQLRWTLQRNVYVDLTGTWTTRGTITGESQAVRNLLLTLSFDF